MTYSIDDMRDAEWDYERDEILAEYDPDDLEEIRAWRERLNACDRERRGEA